jgi:hypothetical protein
MIIKDDLQVFLKNLVISELRNPDPDTNFLGNAGSGSALNQCGSATLGKITFWFLKISFLAISKMCCVGIFFHEKSIHRYRYGTNQNFQSGD